MDLTLVFVIVNIIRDVGRTPWSAADAPVGLVSRVIEEPAVSHNAFKFPSPASPPRTMPAHLIAQALD